MNDEQRTVSSQEAPETDVNEVTQVSGMENNPIFNVQNKEIGQRTLEFISAMQPLAVELYGALYLAPAARQELFAKVEKFLEAAPTQLAQVEDASEQAALTSAIAMLTEQLAVARANAEAIPPAVESIKTPAKSRNPLKWTRRLFTRKK